MSAGSGTPRSDRPRALRLRAGDVVEVRSHEEILATLDADGKLSRMPFMPEMLAFCGRRLRVAAVAHKTCDPAHKTGGRRLEDCVHLEGARCDGSAHGGCQASCLLFWNTAWLKRPDDGPTDPAAAPTLSPAGLQSLTLTVRADGTQIYSCQATNLYHASTPLVWWDIRQYLRDLRSRNVRFGHFSRVLLLSWVRAWMRTGVGYRLARAAYRALHRRLTGSPAPISEAGPIAPGVPTPVRPLELRPGQWVRVRPYPEIRETLSRDSKNRGMWFDQEQIAYCGREFQVERRVERIIHEVTGEMLQMKTPCITLRGMQCRSMYSDRRLFCPRGITPYWREIWLEPVAGPREGAGADT
ncbi:MAG: hypothetical protein ACT4UP_05280 [Gammaproteobacteria bacterium]